MYKVIFIDWQLDDAQLKVEIFEKHGIDYYQISTENTLLMQLNTLLDK